MPDLSFDSLDVIPEGLREDAKQVDGKYVVNVVSNKKLVEFRDTNIALRQKMEQVEPKLTAFIALGDDPAKLTAEVTELRQLKQQVADGKLKGSDAIEQAVNERLNQRMQGLNEKYADLERRHVAKNQESDGWKARYERTVLDQQVTMAAISADSVANPAALPDILSRAAALFVVQPDGTVIPKKGDQVQYGSDGVTPMTVKEWLTKLVAEAPYLGKQSNGGGASGGTGGDFAKVYGMSKADFDKLPPQKRIELARKAKQ